MSANTHSEIEKKIRACAIGLSKQLENHTQINSPPIKKAVQNLMNNIAVMVCNEDYSHEQLVNIGDSLLVIKKRTDPEPSIQEIQERLEIAIESGQTMMGAK